ncbi:MAG: regulatory protein RecX [Candidatus Sumerlaeaceae bacterium]
MQIVALQYVRKRTGGEVHVDFDDGSKLVVDPDLSVQFHLARGMVFNEERHRELVVAQERLSARRRLIRNLSLRKKTAREAERYLSELKFPEHAIEYAVAVAKEHGFLNDAEYAKAYTRSQERSAKKGPRAIRQELRARGVDREIADQAVEPLTDLDVQRASAREVGEKKALALRRKPDVQNAKLKLHEYLMRKGYDPEIALEVTRELLGREDEEP